MNDESLVLTPAGAIHAFGDAEPDDDQRLLGELLSERSAPARALWQKESPDRAARLVRFVARGWVECLPRPIDAPNEVLDDFLPQVIAGLSSERRAALASDAGFCLASIGYSDADAERLCGASADLSGFVDRQRERGWPGQTRAVSFHDDLGAGLPVHSFMRFWVDGIAYWLIASGEPLINNPAFVHMIWSLKLAETRFSSL